jgi:predicted TIM-barrel fold metal-dependent hydrolase
VTVIDAQLHAHDEAQVASHLAALESAGVDGAVLVQTVPQGYDNSFLLAAAAAAPGMFGVVGVVDPASAGVAEAVGAWARAPFALGLRIVALSGERVARLQRGGYEALLTAAERCGVPVFAYAPGNLEALELAAEKHPELVLVLDHLGLPQPPVLVSGGDPWGDFEQVLRLARLPNVALKLSGMPNVSRSAFPFADLWPRVHRQLDAYGAGRLMWGTDITRAGAHHDYDEAVAWLRESEEIGEVERTEILGRALRRLCGWNAAVGAPAGRAA